MEIINNITYPVLHFFGYPILWEHPLFAAYIRKVPIQDAPPGNRGFFDSAGGRWLPKGGATAENIGKWPLLSFSQEDFCDLGPSNVMLTNHTAAAYWSMLFHNAIPEVVPPEIWEEASSRYEDDVFDEWLASNGFEAKGVLIQPGEQMAVLFYVCRNIAISMCLYGRQLILFNSSWTGFVSRDVAVPGDLGAIAREQGISMEEAFFQEHIYNLLQYYHYIHVLDMGKKTLLRRGDGKTFRGTQYKSLTDTPLFFISD